MFKYFVGTLFIVFCCFSITAQVPPPVPYPQGTKVSYIRTWDAMAPEQDAGLLTVRPLRNVKQSTRYFDGTGRLLQTVAKQGSIQTSTGTVLDLVSPVEYDVYGREVFKYLSFTANVTGGNTSLKDGLFKYNPFQQQAAFAATQYQGENYYYSQTVYEASPLNRVTKSFAPGKNWVGSLGNTNEHAVKANYAVNTINDDVRIWKVDNVVNGFGNYSTPSGAAGVYRAGQLVKNITTDEDNKQVIEFKDKNGLVILKKVQLTASPDDGTGRDHAGWLCTYYIYDDLNLLRAVIQPRGVELLQINNIWTLDNDKLNEQCFRYEYDRRSRMIMKKLPGAGEVYMVYDARDRLVMTQDANLRAGNNWMVILYENNLNRVVQTGKLLNTFNNKSFQQHLDDARASAAYPFSPSSTPSAPYWEYLSKTGYDDYATIPATSGLTDALDNGYASHFFSTYNSSPEFAQPLTAATQTLGMVTWTETKVLGTSTYLYTVNIYDEKGRLIQVKSKNNTNGNDIITTQYSWSGQPLIEVQKLENVPASQTSTIVSKLTYDDLGRLTRIEKKVGNSLVNNGVLPVDFSTIVENEYDELGQLRTKQVGKKRDANGNHTIDPLEILSYDYNIRGWLLGVNRDYLAGNNNDPHFGFELGYDKLTNVVSRNFVKPTYNANINGMAWKSVGDGIQRKYDFDYDAANRLLKADFEQHNTDNTWGYGLVDFKIKMGDGVDPNSAYDANGNIKRMQQWGLKASGSAQIDDLRYTYYANTNRLRSVVDFHNDEQTSLADFRTSANHPQKTEKANYIINQGSVNINSITDYTYDVNGNLKKDLNKDIGTASAEDIVYNHLNLPEVITVRAAAGTVKGTITYTYDAAGNKLKKVTVDQSTAGKVITTTTTYLGGIVYESKTTVPANMPNDDYVNKLQFISHDEGRIRYIAAKNNDPARFVYDYFIKDHLGNVRMVLTDQHDVASYFATMETGVNNTIRNKENKLFSNIDTDAYPAAKVPGGYPVDNSLNNANEYVARLNGSGKKAGPAIVLKVMAGDIVDLAVKSFYRQQGNKGDNTSALKDILSSLAGGIVSVSGEAKGALSQLSNTSNSPLLGALNTFRHGKNPDPTGKPKAYLNWVLVDEQFKYVGTFPQSNAIPVGGADQLNTLSYGGINITKNGFLYIYVSNETENWDVFFDDLSVIHQAGPVLEETHYYPFGLTMAGISSKAANIIPNKYKYNSIEQNGDFDLHIYDAFYRNLDPQIGRFWEVDPKIESAEGWSPYNAMLNNPVLYADPLGDSSIPWPARISQTSFNPLGPLIYQGAASVKAEQVRNQYNQVAAKLAKDDKQGRADLKEKTRINTPEPFNTIIEKGRPMEGERAKVNDPNFKGNAAKTNAEVNETLKTTGVIGKTIMVAAAIQSVHTIATSENPVKETVTEGAGWGGAIYGGSEGAMLGGSMGGPYGSLFGGFLGSGIGFFLGKNAVDRALGGKTSENIQNNREIIPDWNPRPGGGLGN